MSENDSFINCENLVKIYKVADLEVVALQGLDLEIQKGQMMSLVGASGSGKSTLLNVLGGLDTPSAGNVFVAGNDLLTMSERERVIYKRDQVGFVWQQPSRNLLPYLTAKENVALPMMLGTQSAAQRSKRALALLDLLGLADRADFKPDRLSGGQQQRVALAIALANNPPLLLADEPTGQLDSAMADQIFEALRTINQTYETTIVIVTHDPKIAAKVDRVVWIRDGRTSTEIRRERNVQDGTVNEEEWVILDRAGRLQLPQVYVDTLAMRGRVRARLENTHVSIWPSTAVSTPQDPQEEVTVWRPSKEYAFDDDNLPLVGETAVQINELWRTFQTDVEEIHAVREMTITIPKGQMVLVKGRSGSGKTTLLNLIGTLDEPTKGEILIDGESITRMSQDEKIHLRRHKIGFVFQTFGLLPFLSARENIEAPLRLLRTDHKTRRQQTDEALALVGLVDRANHRTHELSGGEQQRVALARALVTRPTLILADEPTGQLDTVTGSNIVALLKEVANQTGITVIIASHDPKAEEAADLVFELQDGQLLTES